MGKYMTRCSKGVGEVAVMEVTQVVGVRTRARALALAAATAAAAAAAAAAAGGKRRKAASAAPTDVVQASSYLQLRSRRLVMTSRPPRNSAAGERRAPTAEVASRCSSNDSSEREGEGLESSPCNLDSRRARETTPSSEARREEGDLESTAGATSNPRTPTAAPTETEIEEFFAAAEREQAQRFAERYNYDVINDVPLDGRFGWVRIRL